MRLGVVAIIIILVLSFVGCKPLKIAKKFKSGIPELPVEADTVHFEEEHPIVLLVSINDSPDTFKFILDTGAPTMISPEVANKLGIHRGEKLPSKGVKVHAYLSKEPITISIGKAKVRNFIPLISEFPDEVKGVSGFIGSDFLRFFKVRLDYKTKTLIIARPEYQFPLSNRAVKLEMKTSFPLYFPIFTCEMDSVKAKAMVDVGSPFSIVIPMKYRDILRDVIKSRGIMASWPTKKSVPNYLGRVRSFRMGNFEVKNAMVLSVYLPMPYVLLGRDFLRNFVIILDYPERKIIFDPFEKLEIKTNEFSYGLKLHREEGKLVIQGVWEGSPADRAGLGPGDEILKINGIQVDSMDMKEIEDLLDRTRSLELSVLKPGNNREILVILKKDWLLPRL